MKSNLKFEHWYLDKFKPKFIKFCILVGVLTIVCLVSNFVNTNKIIGLQHVYITGLELIFFGFLINNFIEESVANEKIRMAVNKIENETINKIANSDGLINYDNLQKIFSDVETTLRKDHNIFDKGKVESKIWDRYEKNEKKNI